MTRCSALIILILSTTFVAIILRFVARLGILRPSSLVLALMLVELLRVVVIVVGVAAVVVLFALIVSWLLV